MTEPFEGLPMWRLGTPVRYVEALEDGSAR
jgi:hypothetical protein